MANLPQLATQTSQVFPRNVLRLQGILEVLKENKGQVLRYIHVSTDEAIFGAMRFFTSNKLLYNSYIMLYIYIYIIIVVI